MLWLRMEQFDVEKFDCYGNISYTPAGTPWAVTQAKLNQMYYCIFSQLCARLCDLSGFEFFFFSSFEDNLMELMECKLAPQCVYTLLFFCYAELYSYNFHIQLCVHLRRSIVICFYLTGLFRQSQPGVQRFGCNRDIRPEWQCTWAGQAIYNSHVRLILHRAGQYVFKWPLMSVYLCVRVLFQN